MMLGWLETWGRPRSSERPPMEWMGHAAVPSDGSLMPGMATDTQLDRLRAADGRDADVLFLRLMTVHHRAGAEMAQAAAGFGGHGRDQGSGGGDGTRPGVGDLTDGGHAEGQGREALSPWGAWSATGIA